MNRKTQANGNSINRDINKWYKSALGQAIYAAEEKQVKELLPGLFGYHIVQIGGPDSAQWLETSPIRHHVGVNTLSALKTKSSCVRSLHTVLPFAPESIDVALLPHTLEFTANPEELIKEVISILIPEGTLIFIGFNPFSLFGISAYVPDWRTQFPHSIHFHSVMKCKQWLEKNACDIVNVKTFYFKPPVAQTDGKTFYNLLERLGPTCWPTCGGLYMITARKRVQTLTPIRVNTTRVQMVSRKNVTAPTTRSRL